MKRTLVILTFFSICVVSTVAWPQSARVPAASAATPVPALVPFAGSALDGAGKPVGEAAAITFRIYKDEQGGEPLWSETQNVALDGSGHYKAELGAASPAGLPMGLFGTGEARWLEAEIAGLARQPRVLLASVPYTLKAADAETLAGRSAADYVTREELRAGVATGASAAPQVHPEDPTGTGTAGFVPLWTGTTTLGNSVLAETGTKIGIDTATPATALDVNGQATLRGNTFMPALGTATASGGFNSPVFALSASSFQAGGSAVNQKFAWEVQSQANNTANPSSVLSLLFASGTNGLDNIGLSIVPSGSIFSQANMTVLAKPATATQANPSPKMVMEANAFNSSTSKGVPQSFAWSALPAANDTASPSANLALEFSSGSANPAPTGLSFSPAGIVTFAPGQTFPASNLETTLNPVYAQLGAPNTFTKPQTVNSSLSVVGGISSSGNVNADSFSLGSFPFASGNGSLGDAFLGFSNNTTATGGYNLGVGGGTLAVLSTGASNVAVGALALAADQIGNDNTAVGVNALTSNTIGYNNVAIGEGALMNNANVVPPSIAAEDAGSSNTAVGTDALTENTYGLENVAVGWLALEFNTIGDYNTAVGVNAGVTFSGNEVQGSQNTYIGFQASPGTTNALTHAVAIGANAVVNQSNALILGGTGANSVSVGIGTASPYSDYGLDVEAVNNQIDSGVVVNAKGGNLYLGMTNGAHMFRVGTTGEVWADGGYQTSGADFAESVAVRGKRSAYEPGDLLAIDPSADSRLALARTPYSTLVAGIYSTKPGMLATPHDIDDPRPATSEVPLAVVGIVPCKVTAENGPIRIGDLLVTSSRAGYAMKGTDRRKMLGAVVGKALTALPAGTGVIRVLVTLQ